MAVVAQSCTQGYPQLSLPACMVRSPGFCLPTLLTVAQDECFERGGCGVNPGCPCPENLKGWCEMSEYGPNSSFSRWGSCVVGHCPNDGDITSEFFCVLAGMVADEGRSHDGVCFPV